MPEVVEDARGKGLSGVRGQADSSRLDVTPAEYRIGSRVRDVTDFLRTLGQDPEVAIKRDTKDLIAHCKNTDTPCFDGGNSDEMREALATLTTAHLPMLCKGHFRYADPALVISSRLKGDALAWANHVLEGTPGSEITLAEFVRQLRGRSHATRRSTQ